MNILLNIKSQVASRKSQVASRKSQVAKFSVLLAENRIKLLFIAVVLFQFTIFAQPPQAVTYLRVVNPATNPVLTHTEDFTKNHVVLPHPEEDGYMMCMAAHVNTSVGFIWAIRLISVDANNTFLWSRDITLTNQYSQNDVHSTTPFAMCYNNNNDGFVIAGIYDPLLPNSNSLSHNGVNNAFYMDVDLGGNVTSMYSTTSIQSGIGYAPLTITPTGNGYITGGLLHNNLLYPTNETCGYISEIGNNFVEIRGNRIHSSFVPQPSLPPNYPLNHDHRFDVVNNIKKTQTGHYVISGTTTTDLFEVLHPFTPSYYSGVAGSHDGFIAYLNPNWDVIWANNWHEYNHNSSFSLESGFCATSILDFAIDEDENKIYMVGNEIRKWVGNGQFLHGLLFKLDLMTGTLENYLMNDKHQNYPQGFFSQIFIHQQELFILGFAYDGSGANIPFVNTNKPSLHPFCYVRELGSMDPGNNSFIINGKNAGYRMGNPNLYEGQLNITFEQTNGSKPQHPLYTSVTNYYVNLQMQHHYGLFTSPPPNFYYNNQKGQPYAIIEEEINAPLVYHPKSWHLDAYGKLHCVNLKNAELTGLIPGIYGTPMINYVNNFNYHPTLYVDIFNNDQCFNKFEEIFDDRDDLPHPLVSLSLISIEGNKMTANPMLSNFNPNIMLEMSECNYQGELSESKTQTNFNSIFKVYNRDQGIYFDLNHINQNLLKNVDVEKPITDFIIKVIDITGKEIINLKVSQNLVFHTEKLRKGIYFYYISDLNGKIIQCDKVAVF